MTLELYQRLFSAPFRVTEPEFVARLDQANSDGDTEAKCRALLNLAFAHIHMGSSASAIPLVQSALKVASDNHIAGLAAEAMLWRDVAIHFSNDHSTPTDFDGTLTFLAETSQHDLVPIVHVLRAREVDRTDGNKASLAHVDQALSALQNTVNPYTKVFVNRLSAMLLRSQDQFSQAVALLEEARIVAERFGFTSQVARTLGAIGATFVADQRPREGLTELLRAIELYEALEIHDWYAAETFLNIAVLHHLGHEPEAGIPYATRSMELFGLVGDRGEQARAEYILGQLYEGSGDLEGALTRYLNSFSIFQETTSKHPASSLPRSSAANILAVRGEFDKAVSMAHEALAHAEDSNSSIGKSQAHAFLGSIYDIKPSPVYNPEVAEKHLLTGYNIDLGRGVASPLVLDRLAKLYEQRGEFERALRYTKELFHYQERVRDASAQRRIVHLEARRRIEEAQQLAEIEHLRNVELKAAQTLLVESERLASLGQLTAGIAHEINNPITFISSAISPLRRDILELISASGTVEHQNMLRSEILELLDAIESGARRTSEIVSSLRLFSRLDEGAIKESNIIEGIESTITLLSMRIRGQVEIVRNYDDIPSVECRPGQINQVIMNLLSNALDALENTPKPTIAISVKKLENDCIEIEVADNGPGIPLDVLSQVFEPFFTTKEVGKGTGLGLSISYGIIERHGGRISVTNTPGASFKIVLPIVQLPSLTQANAS